jgi:hypothetical protein
MNDNPLGDLPSFDRVSIRAVLVGEGEDPTELLARAGIVDAVAIPVVFDDDGDLDGGLLGDGITPNLTAVLETEQDEDEEASPHAAANANRTQPGRSNAFAPGTKTLPAAFGMSPLAPVRQRRT